MAAYSIAMTSLHCEKQVYAAHKGDWGRGEGWGEGRGGEGLQGAGGENTTMPGNVRHLGKQRVKSDIRDS